MSEQSSFVIIRHDLKNKKYLNDEEFLKAREYCGLIEDSFRNHKIEEKELPPYFSVDRLHKVNKETKEVYDKIMELDFLSDFTVLKDEYNLSSWGTNCVEVIPYAEAKSMLRAINYLLLEHYDLAFETEVLKNYYLSLFSEMYTKRYNFLYAGKKDDEGNSCEINLSDTEYNDERNQLKRIKLILDAYVTLVDEDHWNDLDYELLYTVH